MLDVLVSALAELLQVQHIAFMMLGIVVGLAIGVLPGLGGIAGLSLLIPFLYGMDDVSALAMLIGLVAVIPTSDTFSSVLMGIPGSSASQATVLDGFPMAKRGEAARALSGAFISSMFGGVVGALVLTGFVLIARPLILAFGSAELFMLSLLGLSMVAVLAGRSLAKGLAGCGLGLLIGSMGGAPATGEFRMVYGIDYLYDGIPLVVVGLGLFAVPEIADLLRRNQAIAEGARLGAGWLRGFRDWLANIWLSIRCAILGCLIGAIPGLGGSVVDWLAYGHAVQTTKDTSQFGKGDPRGVIAPESANNAMQGGALLPTLMFGIPGSGSMAVFLGGMILIGVEPGPSMVTTNLDLTYSIIWSLALANIFGAGICLALAGPIARLTRIPFQFLAPFMIMVICFAAFQATRDIADLIALFALGALGVLLKRFGWPRPALLIGFVLAPQAETFLYQAVQFNGWGMLARPGVLILGAIIALSVIVGLRNRIDDSAPMAAAKGGLTGAQRLPQVAFALFAIALFAVALVDALGHSFLGNVFPLSVVAVSGSFAVVLLVQLLTGVGDGPAFYDAERQGDHVGRDDIGSLWGGLAWIGLLIALSAAVGFVIALVAFFLAFLPIRARASLPTTLLLTACAAGFVIGLADLLNLNFPSGVLQQMVDLPWPIR